MKLAALLAALVLPSLAWASQPKQLAFPVGTTTTVSLGAPVSKVTVSDPSLVEVKKQGRKVIFIARETGRTEVVVKTADGEQRFSVYVAKDKYALPY
ncbi:MAG: pilus assembly protein N-terminal domain-containing protein [Myxococcales bacterium]|nr:pilus assembly protein N-terminal domain-containing protein [Myxococcales bacterium]